MDMNFDLILIGLGITSVLTTCCTEALKKLVTDRKPTITALIVAIVLSIGISVIYVVYNNIAINAQVICTIIVFIFFSFLGSTLGFDKLKQIIEQIKGGNE